MLAAVDDVARKAAETKGELAAEVEKSADEDEEAAEKKKSAAEFAERVHGEHCNGGRGGKGRRGGKGGKGSKGSKGDKGTKGEVKAPLSALVERSSLKEAGRTLMRSN